MTTTTTAPQDQQPTTPDQPTRIFAQWGLPHTVTPRFGARLIQEHHRLHFLSDRASLIGEWAEEAIDRLEAIFPAIIKELEAKLLTGELDARRQQRITIQHNEFTCDWQLWISLYLHLPYNEHGRQSWLQGVTTHPLVVTSLGLLVRDKCVGLGEGQFIAFP
ncbi:type IV toxin-antitoxin system YeeU family antitoxin [Aeromonas jandaei]